MKVAAAPPAVMDAEEGVMIMLKAAARFTVIPVCEPVIELVTVSVAVID